MVFISYPNRAQEQHPDILRWKATAAHAAGSWTDLKPYLARHTERHTAAHAPKCWYSELPLADNYSVDVEHFRPKNSGSPLTATQLKAIRKLAGFDLPQSNVSGTYPWLEFDHRNYRLVTATTNRAGAKHIYFPVAAGTQRLAHGQLPWQVSEFSFFLDPADPDDCAWLTVLANGHIMPAISKQLVEESHLSDPAAHWDTPSVGYMRAWATIHLYRLNHDIFVTGRKRVYDATSAQLDTLVQYLALAQQYNFSEGDRNMLLRSVVKDLFNAMLPSAPFALAARCAMRSFVLPDATDSAVSDAFRTVLTRIESELTTIHQADLAAQTWN